MGLALFAGLVASGSLAQEEPAADQSVQPAGVAVLTLRQQQTTLPFSLSPRGPLLALQPIALALGVELRLGPLGESHTLVFADREILVGPGSATLVSMGKDGSRPLIQPLSQPPTKDAEGLKVPLDFLQNAIGEELGYELLWDPDRLELRVDKRQLRQLDASVTLVHQYRVSTVEIQFSVAPRYRIDRLPNEVVVSLAGDRLRLPVERSLNNSPFVEDVVVTPEGIRILLKPGATAAEPRFLQSPMARLILEIFQQTQAQTATPGSRPRDVPERAGGVRTIVLDPGHGGGETGAIGSRGTAEKDLNLLIARGLQRQLERRLPVQVVLTRTSDVALSFDGRTAVANQNKADLFISLHLNSSFGSRAHGSETYFLSREASDQLAATAAETENRYGGGGSPEHDLQLILWDLAQSYHLSASQRFANLVQEELNLTLDLRNRGVKQAPFKVLMGAQMPAVLVELGFLSNPEEEARLQSPSYRAELIDALVRAVARFRTQTAARASGDQNEASQ